MMKCTYAQIDLYHMLQPCYCITGHKLRIGARAGYTWTRLFHLGQSRTRKLTTPTAAAAAAAAVSAAVCLCIVSAAARPVHQQLTQLPDNLKHRFSPLKSIDH